MPFDSRQDRIQDAERVLLTAERDPLSDAFLTLTEILRQTTAVRVCGEALEIVFALLHTHYQVRALALEVVVGAVMRFQPYGDMAALSTETSAAVRKFPLEGVSSLTGSITFACSPESSPPMALLEAVAAQIAHCMEKEVLMAQAEEAEERARQRISEVATIYEIGKAVDSIALPRLFQMIADRAAHLLDAHSCAVMQIDETTGALRVEASYGAENAERTGEQVEESIAGRVVQTGQPILTVSGAHVTRENGEERAAAGPLMLAPMKSPEGKVLGILSISRQLPAPDFIDSDLKLFSVFATQAALALTNHQLYENLRQRAVELGKLSTLSRALISTIDLEHLLHSVAEDICQVVGFGRCCLFIHDPLRHVYVPRVWRGYPDSIGRNPVREREGVIGGVGRDKETRRFDAREPVPPDQERDKGYMQRKGFARSLGADSFVAAPILSGKNECIGVVVADNRGCHDPISLEQVRLLTAFISQVGIAIENAQLYVKTQEDYTKIRRLIEYNEKVLQSIPAGILATDGQGEIVRCNRAAEDILKQPRGSLRGLTLREIIAQMSLPETEQEKLLELILHVQETGESVHQHKVAPRSAGHPATTLNLNLSRLMDHKQERAGIVMSLEDVTQEVQLAEQVERMRRLADIGQLAAKMAHEVRNALSPIKGAAQIIKVELEGQGAGTEWPDIIIAEVDGLSQLTSSMLDFARPIPLDPAPLCVAELLVSAVMSLSTFLHDARVHVEWDLPSDLPEVNADRVQLGQVIRNLVINAAQSMSEGGTLKIAADFDPETGFLAMRFRDYGVGIAGEEIDRIFRPFVTTKPKGSGLGLAIVNKIIAHHGGRVEVVSQVGEGACFSVLLPLNPPRERAEMGVEELPLISSRPLGPFPDK